MTMLHSFKAELSNISVPKRFTNPFSYVPHELSILAYEQLLGYLDTQTVWHEELNKGKMFGVLVVKDKCDKLGFLASFSGNLNKCNLHSYFVPPIYDLMSPDGDFKAEENSISAINHKIDVLVSGESYLESKKQYNEFLSVASFQLNTAKNNIITAKENRDNLRKGELSISQEQELKKESQYLKAELKRLKDANQIIIDELKVKVDIFEVEILALKKERKERSLALQMWLFDKFQLLNFKGEARGLCSIFEQTPQKTPPAGAGECAAPKLLQYAYANELTPLTMAEFWWGESPKGEVRHHGQFYTACRGKCLPILGFMLQGLDVDDDRSYYNCDCDDLTILYEDQWLVAVDKPCGMLSVDGKSAQKSVMSILRQSYPELNELIAVHRLDMDTSGILLVAKNFETYKYLQNEFKSRNVKKRYIAMLDGVVSSDCGEITLPLSANYMDRPRQMIDSENGKSSITRYRVLKRTDKTTLVEFFPLTGRTHQLRVHSASVLGLNAPIVGDRLYGAASDRMYLHAQSIEFCHPETKETIIIELPSDVF